MAIYTSFVHQLAVRTLTDQIAGAVEAEGVPVNLGEGPRRLRAVAYVPQTDRRAGDEEFALGAGRHAMPGTIGESKNVEARVGNGRSDRHRSIGESLGGDPRVRHIVRTLRRAVCVDERDPWETPIPFLAHPQGEFLAGDQHELECRQRILRA
ncbi:hypothetical protein SDC9_49497 [bioreactor metagenome]|uniref:Uncharacterized protein n=1 Tax=bioreactor metagenome TaxID=1076179 RepID=A0A644WHI8_9ZZZZ